MAFVELQTRVDLPSYHYRVSLDGVTFTLYFTFNDRMGKWFVKLADRNGVTLLAPVPLAVNWPLVQRFQRADLPAGELIAYDTSGKNEDAGRFDLGDRVRLIYKEAAA
jgi:hypothetical protein